MKFLVAALALVTVLIATSPLATGESIVIDKLWSTTWDYSQVQELSNPNVAFRAGTALTASLNVTSDQSSKDKTLHDQIGISILENQKHQIVDAFGGGITDSVAISLQAFKSKHPKDYDDLLHLMFSQEPEWFVKGGVGMNTVRVPLGACDFGVSPYTFDDTEDGSDDPNFELFTIKKAPKLWNTLHDIVKINPALKIIVASWSAPAWMKENGNADQPLFGGNLKSGMEEMYAKYLVRAVVDIGKQENLKVFAMSAANEPQYAGENYPTMKLTAEQETKIGRFLRKGLDAAGLKEVKLFVWDHNWDNTDYPMQVLNADPTSWDAIAWHGYAGSPSSQKVVADAFPDKDTYFTEMTRVTQYFNEPYKNMKSTARELLIGSIRYMSRSVLMWNLVLRKDEDGFTTPHLPKVCLNCNAAILLLPDSTAALSTSDPNQTKTLGEAQDKSKRAFLRRRADDVETVSLNKLSEKTGAIDKAAEAVPASKIVDAQKTGNTDVYTSDLFKRTSDFSVLSHLSTAVRPQGESRAYSHRIGVTSTDELTELGGRVLAQAFRQDGVKPGISRFSVILLNQNDHYETGVFEAATSVIAFRGMVANVTTVPGLYTISWEAPTVATESESEAEKQKITAVGSAPLPAPAGKDA